MFYKKENDNWWCSDWVSNKNYTLNENNKQSIDGWEWHDTPPQEYLDWLEEQQIEEEE